MDRGCCMPVRRLKRMQWNYDDYLCARGTKETYIHVLFECKCYNEMRRNRRGHGLGFMRRR